MVTSNASPAPDAEAAKKKAERRAVRKAGREAGDKTGNKAGNKGKKNLSLLHIGRRIEAIQKQEDQSKARKARSRLLLHVLTGIADGSVKQPDKAAQAVLDIMPKKGDGKGKGKGKGSSEGDGE
jgi:hypothetical protein